MDCLFFQVAECPRSHESRNLVREGWRLPVDKKEVSAVRYRKKARQDFAVFPLVESRHGLGQVLDMKGRAIAVEKRQIAMLRKVHIQMHGVVTLVSLKHARHRGGSRRAEISKDKIGRTVDSLKASTCSQCALVGPDIAGPITLTPLVDVKTRFTNKTR